MDKLLFNIYKFHINSFCKNNCKTLQNFICLRNKVTIPKYPSMPGFSSTNNGDVIEIDEKTMKHLERLSLVNLDDSESLKNFKRNIRFATNIVNFDTTNVEPLYTVLEDEPLQMRSDEVKVEHTREEILRMAKCIEDDYYVAPPGNIPIE